MAEPVLDEDEINRLHREKMARRQAARRKVLATRTEERGLLIVHTGAGKGKSTAAFGMVLRCLGHGMRVGVVQFVKGAWETGERNVLASFPDLVTCRAMGEGFTWDTQDRARDIAAARAAWDIAQAMIAEPSYKLVLLDELNIVLRYDYLPLDDIVAALQAKPRDLHVVVTGRNAQAGADRGGRSRHRDDPRQAPLPRRRQGAEGDRVLRMASLRAQPSAADNAHFAASPAKAGVPPFKRRNDADDGSRLSPGMPEREEMARGRLDDRSRADDARHRLGCRQIADCRRALPRALRGAGSGCGRSSRRTCRTTPR